MAKKRKKHHSKKPVSNKKREREIKYYKITKTLSFPDEDGDEVFDIVAYGTVSSFKKACRALELEGIVESYDPETKVSYHDVSTDFDNVTTDVLIERVEEPSSRWEVDVIVVEDKETKIKSTKKI